MGVIRTIFSLASLLLVGSFLTACAGTVPATIGLTEASVPQHVPDSTQSVTKVGLLPMKTVAGELLALGGGWSYQPIESIQPSICGEKVVMITGVYHGPNGEMVPATATSMSAKITCATVLPPAVTGVAMLGSANQLAGAITGGSSTLASAIKVGASTTADGLGEVGDGLNANADAIDHTADSLQSTGDSFAANADTMTKMMAMMQCQAKGIPALVATCMAALPQ